MEDDLRVGPWLIQPRLRSASNGSRTVSLEPKVLKVLVCLAEHAGEVVEKEKIIQTVWPDTFVTDDVLTRAIGELRRIFDDDPKEPRFIRTIPKSGYRLIAQVEPVAPVSPRATSVERPLLQRRRARIAGGALLVLMTLILALNLAGLRDRLFPRSVPVGKVRLVVLPFDNYSGDPEQEYFSDGITEEMTAQLARLQPERLLVIGRASAMTYKGRKKSIEEVGKTLNVQYVLEGSVRRQGNRVRITAQLVEVGDQTHVWAQSYEYDLRDVLVVQAEVARVVAREISFKVSPIREARFAQTYHPRPEIYEAYLRGRYFWNKRTFSDYRKAVAFYRAAIHDDPGYAPAYAGLADSLFYLGEPGAKDAALKALELDAKLSEAHATLGQQALYDDWDWETAGKEFRLAIQLNPNYPTAHHWFGDYLFFMGQPQEAIEELRKALELEPLSLIIRADLAQTMAAVGQDEMGLLEARKVLEQDLNFAKVHRVLAMIYARKRMLPEALREFNEAKELGDGTMNLLADSGYAYALAGQRGAANKIVRELKSRARRDGAGPPAGEIAIIFVALGDKDLAFDWLEKALQQRDGVLLGLKADGTFDGLRADPRFETLLRRMNFPP